jgi:hypothetical protein
MQRATITLPSDLLTELVGVTNARSKTEAVMTAIKNEIRLGKLETIKSMAGKMEFTQTASELRHGDDGITTEDFWCEKSLEELVAEQGIQVPTKYEEVLGGGANLWDSDEDFDTFLMIVEGVAK